MGNSPITGKPYVTPDDITKYSQLGLKQRTGFAQGVAANLATDTALQNQAFVNQLHGANTYQSAAAGGLDLARTGLITNPRPVPPVQAVPVPGATGVTAITGGGLGKEPVIKGDVTSDMAGQAVMVNGKEVGKYDSKGEMRFIRSRQCKLKMELSR